MAMEDHMETTLQEMLQCYKELKQVVWNSQPEFQTPNTTTKQKKWKKAIARSHEKIHLKYPFQSKQW